MSSQQKEKKKVVSVKTASWHRSHTNGKQRLQFCQVPLNSSTMVSQTHLIGNEYMKRSAGFINC